MKYNISYGFDNGEYNCNMSEEFVGTYDEMQRYIKSLRENNECIQYISVESNIDEEFDNDEDFIDAVAERLTRDIRRMFDEYDDEMEELKSEYNHRYDDLPVNSAGEVIASELMEINCWYVQEENRIKNEMTQKFVDLNKEVK